MITAIAAPILLLDRQRNWWRRLLSEKSRAFAEARWWNKWGELLSTREQALLLTARARGRFRYGDFRYFAAKSVVRFTPLLLTAALLGVGSWAVAEYEAGSEAEAKLFQIDDPTILSEDTVSGLDNLKSRSWITRWRVSHDLLTSPTQAGQFALRPDPILRALVGMDSDRLNGLIKAYVVGTVNWDEEDPRLGAAVGTLIASTSPLALDTATRRNVERIVLDHLRSDSGDIPLELISEFLKKAALASTDGFDAGMWLPELRAAILRTDDNRAYDLARAYAELANSLQTRESQSRR